MFAGLLGEVHAIGEYRFILIIDQVFEHLGVMFVGRGAGILGYQLAFGIHFGVVFVAIVPFTAFAGPTPITIFLPSPGWRPIPGGQSC